MYIMSGATRVQNVVGIARMTAEISAPPPPDIA